MEVLCIEKSYEHNCYYLLTEVLIMASKVNPTPTLSGADADIMRIAFNDLNQSYSAVYL